MVTDKSASTIPCVSIKSCICTGHFLCFLTASCSFVPWPWRRWCYASLKQWLTSSRLHNIASQTVKLFFETEVTNTWHMKDQKNTVLYIFVHGVISSFLSWYHSAYSFFVQPDACSEKCYRECTILNSSKIYLFLLYSANEEYRKENKKVRIMVPV
jgi:hypothetical protein